MIYLLAVSKVFSPKLYYRTILNVVMFFCPHNMSYLSSVDLCEAVMCLKLFTSVYPFLWKKLVDVLPYIPVFWQDFL